MSVGLVVDDLRASYGAVEVLHGVSFEVRAGEVLAVLGPNGAGKSTLVRCIAGLHASMSGSVSVGGAELRRGDARGRREVGLTAVGDRRDLVPSLSVERYLHLILDDEGVGRAYDAFPPLAELASRRCGLLSGGEAQMLALARAVAGRPHVVVVDEISQGLAPVMVSRLLPVLRDTAASGTAVLLVEQFAHAAARVADRVIMLEQGRVSYEGTVEGAPLDEAYLGDAARDEPPPSPFLTDVTVGLLPAQRRDLAARAANEGRLSGEIVREALDAYLAKRPRRRARS
jgi:branched-chain amino acid transport system ATP-binding protein